MYKQKYYKYKHKYNNIKREQQHNDNNNMVDLIKSFKKISGIVSLEIYQNKDRTIVLCGDRHRGTIKNKTDETNTTVYGIECENCNGDCISIVDLPDFLANKLSNKMDYYLETYYDPITKTFPYSLYNEEIYRQTRVAEINSINKSVNKYHDCITKQNCPNLRVHATDLRYRDFFPAVLAINDYLNNLKKFQDSENFTSPYDLINMYDNYTRFKKETNASFDFTFIDKFPEIRNIIPNIIDNSYLNFNSIPKIKKYQKKIADQYNISFSNKLKNVCIERINEIENEFKSTINTISDMYNNMTPGVFAKAQTINELLINLFENASTEFIDESKYILLSNNINWLRKFFNNIGFILLIYGQVIMDIYTFHRMHLKFDGKIQENILVFEGSIHTSTIAILLIKTGLYKQIYSKALFSDFMSYSVSGFTIYRSKAPLIDDYNKCLEL